MLKNFSLVQFNGKQTTIKVIYEMIWGRRCSVPNRVPFYLTRYIFIIISFKDVFFLIIPPQKKHYLK